MRRKVAKVMQLASGPKVFEVLRDLGPGAAKPHPNARAGQMLVQNGGFPVRGPYTVRGPGR